MFLLLRWPHAGAFGIEGASHGECGWKHVASDIHPEPVANSAIVQNEQGDGLSAAEIESCRNNFADYLGRVRVFGLIPQGPLLKRT